MYICTSSISISLPSPDVPGAGRDTNRDRHRSRAGEFFGRCQRSVDRIYVRRWDSDDSPRDSGEFFFWKNPTKPDSGEIFKEGFEGDFMWRYMAAESCGCFVGWWILLRIGRWNHAVLESDNWCFWANFSDRSEMCINLCRDAGSICVRLYISCKKGYGYPTWFN